MGLKAAAKRAAPDWLLKKIRPVLAARGSMETPEIPLEDRYPWSSPDVWERVVSHYRDLDSPTVFEYGTGASTLAHLKNLRRGRYIGVEHDLEWLTVVSTAIQRWCMRTERKAEVEVSPSEIHIRFDAVEVTLKYRPDREHYPDALEPCDVVVIDGKERKRCVNHVLDTRHLRTGGLVVLFEAGRGIPGWLGWPALEGASDYRPEVERMRSLGGELVDGSGTARWPGGEAKDATALHYPAEACFLVRDGF